MAPKEPRSFSPCSRQHTNQTTLQGTITYPTGGKGKSSSKVPLEWDMLVPWRVFLVLFDVFFFQVKNRYVFQTISSLGWYLSPPPKANMSPKERNRFKRKLHFPTIDFSGTMLIFGMVIIFKYRSSSSWWLNQPI